MTAIIILSGVISILSFLAILFLVIKKLPEIKKNQLLVKKESWCKKIQKRIISRINKEKLNSEIYLQKILSKIKIISLKVESQTEKWLINLRTKAKERKAREEYLKNILKLKKRKKTPE